MRNRFEIAFLRYVRRHIPQTLTMLYLIPVLWGGLVPFDFTAPLRPNVPTDSWLALPLTPVHLPDMASNVALYLPLGLFLRLSFVKRGKGALTSLFATTALGAGLAYVIEYSQIYSSSRVASAGDWTCNVLGTLLGAACAAVFMLITTVIRSYVWRAADKWRESVVLRPSGVLAGLCALVLFLAAVAPFDVTFSPNRIYESAKDTRFEFFSRQAPLSPALIPATTEESAGSRHRVARNRWQVRLDYLWTVVGYVLLAVLLCRYLAAHCRVIGARRASKVFAACAMLALLSCAARLFIISRTADVTDVFMALVGTACGVLAADRLIETWSGRARALRGGVRSGRKRLVTTVLAGWCVFIVARQTAPFSPSFSLASVGNQIRLCEWLPLRSYQQTRLPVAAHDMLAKLARYVWLGVLICVWRSERGLADERQRVLSTALFVGVAVAVLECGQLFLPSRVPSVTDVGMAMFGAAGGVAAFRIARAYVEGELTARSRRVLFNVDLDVRAPAPIEAVR